jgi:hypothetical protein
MLNLIEKYKDFIKAFHVSQYELEANTYRLKVQLTFLDESNLVIKEYLFKIPHSAFPPGRRHRPLWAGRIQTLPQTSNAAGLLSTPQPSKRSQPS